MNGASIPDIVERLKKGTSPEELLLSVLSPEERRIIDACVLVRSIDRAVYEEVLGSRVLEGAASFEDLERQAFLERDGRRDGAFRVRPSIRRLRFSRLREEAKQAWAGWHDALAQHYRGRAEPAATLEELYHTAAFDPGAAGRRVEELFSVADARFDLVRCGDVLDAVSAEELLPLPDELEKRVTALRSHHRARLRWADEYYRSVSYLERKALDAHADRVLDGAKAGDRTEPWIHQIVAKGGMGKTAFLRWLIARRAVPERIPCAKVDFDFVERTHAAREPARLLVTLVTQLDDQIGGRAFREILARFAARERLGSTATNPGSADLPHEIGAALRGSNPGVVLLVLDTTEESILYDRETLPHLIEAVARIHDEYAGVRLILSGRYDLREKLADERFAERFGDALAPVVVEPFSNEEARRYLVEKRDVSEAEFGKDVIDAVIRKAEGIPFKLALLCDLLRAGEPITAETIDSYPSADLLYLIERVVERLPNPLLRWVLRYGVIPEPLDRTFLVEVMCEHLKRALAGGSGDDPRRGLETIRGRENVFPTGLLDGGATIDLDALWSELLQYASSVSWVSREANDTVWFHPEVRRPMLDLLRKQEVCVALHRDAAAYFERRAAAEPGAWESWMSRAVQHRFEVDGAKILDWFDAAPRDDRTERRLALARLVLEPVRKAFLDEKGAPRVGADGKPLAEPARVCRVYRVIARTALDLAWSPAPDDWMANWPELDRPPWKKQAALWEEARRAATARGLLASTYSFGETHGAEDAWLEGSLLLFAGDAARAIEVLANAPASDDGALRVAIEYALGEARAACAQKTAQNHFRKAVELAEALRLPEEHGLPLRVRLARELLAWDVPHAAVRGLTKPLVATVPSTNIAGMARGFDALAEALIADGRAESAQRYIGWQEARARALHSRAHLGMRNPRAALVPVTASQALLSSLATLADEAEANGRALADLLDIHRAYPQFQEARKYWIELGAREAALRCLLPCIDLALECGDIRRATRFLQEAERDEVASESEFGVLRGLASAKVLLAKGEGDEARTTLRWLLHIESLPPRQLLRIAFVMLSADQPDDAWRLIRDALARVPSVTARLALLAPLLRSTPRSKLPEWILGTISKAIPPVIPRGLKKTEAMMAGLAAAELYAVMGRGPTAHGLLEQAADLARNNLEITSFPVVDLVRIGARLGVAPDRLDEMRRDFEREFVDHPLLLATVLLQRAEILVDQRAKPDKILPLLDHAEPALQGTVTRWNVRHELLRAHIASALGREQEADERMHVVDALVNELGGPSDETVMAPKRRRRRGGVVRDNAIPREVAETPSPENVVVRIPANGDPAWESILKSLRPYHSPFASKAAPYFTNRWPESATRMGAALAFLKAFPDHPSNVCLEIDDEVIAVLPWELARMPGDQPLSRWDRVPCLYRASGTKPPEARAQVAWVQRTLSAITGNLVDTDGIAGAATAAAVTSFQRTQGLPETGVADVMTRLKLAEAERAQRGIRRPLALVMKPSRGRSTAAQRSLDKGVEVELLYERAGFVVVVVEDPEPKKIIEAFGVASPSLLHIGAALLPTHAERGVALDFAAEWQRGARDLRDIRSELEAYELSEVLDQLPPGAPRPVIVLDVPRPSIVEETVLLVFMRNAFAASLLDLQCVPAVLATMLDPLAAETMTKALGAGKTVGEVCREITTLDERVAYTDLAGLLGRAATALFTHAPDTRATSGGAK
ncbi:peptidoglycan-binding protein [Polyangium sp. y55x31]|uniref:peptidoglycan-binding protein n=1 Tax=Polyangium sp. y55x31 TaxID=3042688 RepID=UPI00248255F8|nr:peptidoglycan-binding protein [Polyangium sp. y55x31]MDI1478910.1 peptidoglycan-binding protein [Polyangium sp. y55x31]